MNVGLWAEIRRLHEIEKFSGRAIALRLDCSRDTVTRALHLDQPPSKRRVLSAVPLGEINLL